MSRRQKLNLAIICLALYWCKVKEGHERFFWQQMRPSVNSFPLGKLVLMISKKQQLKFLAERFRQWRVVARLLSGRLAKVKDKLERLGQIYNMKNLALNGRRLRQVKKRMCEDLVL